MKLGTEVGLGPGHIVLDGDRAPPPQRGTAPIFGPCLLWIKMPSLGRKVGLGPSHIVLDRDPAPSSEQAQPQFSVHVYCGQTVAHLSTCLT